MRRLDEGESFVVTRNGVPVGELTPLRRLRFVSAEAVTQIFRNAPPIDADDFRRDLDAVASQDIAPRGDEQPARGILDTSVVIDLETLDVNALPLEVAVTTLTMAELAAGPHAGTDAAERARREDRLQRTEAAFAPLPFDADATRAYGRVDAAVIAAGRKQRCARSVDLTIAAIACLVELPPHTRNPDDFAALDGLVDIVAIRDIAATHIFGRVEWASDPLRRTNGTMYDS